MNPFFFGTSAEPLFGVFHPAKSSTAQPVAVLLCCPLGWEQMRSHRAFRQLALLLSRAGFCVMRFDYYGTGDSAGDGESVSLEHCVADVEVAVEELQAMSGMSSVALVGLRMGASIAALAAQRIPGLSKVVLWDPVTDGAEHLRELLSECPELDNLKPGMGIDSIDGTAGVIGFPFTRRLREEIQRVNIAALPAANGPEYVIVVSAGEDEFRRFCEGLRERGRSASFHSVPSEGNWNEVDDNGSALIPQAVIRRIVDHLVEGVA